MLLTRLILKNWRNFPAVDVPLSHRAFLVGPNAAGKSNFLDALRFLKDVAQDGGGLQKAIEKRGGLSKIRCLAARKDPDIHLEVHLTETLAEQPLWKYAIGIKQEPRGNRLCYLSYERVWKNGVKILDRPNNRDKSDRLRLTQTFLEQINSNSAFREIASYLKSIQYLHLIPQLVRFSDMFSGKGVPGDPFGLHFLEKLALSPEKTRQARLRKIQGALKIAVPQLEELDFVRDERGMPHLEVRYSHWRPHGGKQREDQFSDGTLRLIGFLWSLLDGNALLLLEEPELSLHPGIVKLLPGLMYRLIGKKRQMMITTHSSDLLSDKGIGAAETIILKPGAEGTEVQTSSDIQEVTELLSSGFSIADAVLPRTQPENIDQLQLFPKNSIEEK